MSEQDRDETWIHDDSLWQQKPDATHYRLVYDPEYGALAEATTPDGRVFYGSTRA